MVDKNVAGRVFAGLALAWTAFCALQFWRAGFLGACPSNPLRTTDGGVGSVVVDRSDAKSVRGLRQAA